MAYFFFLTRRINHAEHTANGICVMALKTLHSERVGNNLIEVFLHNAKGESLRRRVLDNAPEPS
jgi:hypothetical protein